MKIFLSAVLFLVALVVLSNTLTWNRYIVEYKEDVCTPYSKVNVFGHKVRVIATYDINNKLLETGVCLSKECEERYSCK